MIVSMTCTPMMRRLSEKIRRRAPQPASGHFQTMSLHQQKGGFLTMTAKRRSRKTPKRQRGQFYLHIEFWEMDSPAFLALSADATRVYLFMRKRLNFDNANNGYVVFSHRDAAEVLHAGGWERGWNALAELKHFGFIKLRDNGAPASTIRLASEWQLTAFPCGGQAASKDFMRHDGAPFQPRKRDREKQLPIGTIPTHRDYPDAP
jgi:hypothetical protein